MGADRRAAADVTDPKGDDMTGTMLVTGGTGTLGRQVVARLRAAGRDVRVLSRTGGDVTGDLATGEGIGAAVAGVHDLVLATVRGMARLPVVPVPSGFRLQPVDAAEVADRLAELAQGEPAGLVGDLGGPRSYELRELLRGYLRARGAHRLLVGVRLPGGAARAYRAGANLTPERAVGRRTWEAFLDEHLRATSNAAPGREALV
jgi:uncharacterized protein YbjT (DUF2867 family)